MLCTRKQSRNAKLQRQNARTAFGKPSTSTPSPEHSVYCVSDNGSDGSIVCLESGASSEEESDNESRGKESDNESKDKVEVCVESLQAIYSVFLPPHLCREAMA